MEQQEIMEQQDQPNKDLLDLILRRNNLESIKEVLEQGVDINCRNSIGFTAMHILVDQGHTDRINYMQYLVERGININEKTREGYTALHEAAWRNQIDSVKFLLEHGADESITSKEGKTACDLAEIRDNKQIVAFLHSFSEAQSLKKMLDGMTDNHLDSTLVLR